MMFNKHLGKQELDLETMEYADSSVFDCHGGGGKGGSAPAPARPQVAPAPPVEEASVEIDDDSEDKLNTGKSSLKMPVKTGLTTGVKI